MGMVGMKGVSVGISEPDTIADEPRVADEYSKNSRMLVAIMEV